MQIWLTTQPGLESMTFWSWVHHLIYYTARTRIRDLLIMGPPHGQLHSQDSNPHTYDERWWKHYLIYYTPRTRIKVSLIIGPTPHQLHSQDSIPWPAIMSLPPHQLHRQDSNPWPTNHEYNTLSTTQPRLESMTLWSLVHYLANYTARTWLHDHLIMWSPLYSRDLTPRPSDHGFTISPISQQVHYFANCPIRQ